MRPLGCLWWRVALFLAAASLLLRSLVRDSVEPGSVCCCAKECPLSGFFSTHMPHHHIVSSRHVTQATFCQECPLPVCVFRPICNTTFFLSSQRVSPRLRWKPSYLQQVLHRNLKNRRVYPTVKRSRSRSENASKLASSATAFLEVKVYSLLALCLPPSTPPRLGFIRQGQQGRCRPRPRWHHPEVMAHPRRRRHIRVAP